jgi:LPS export ABC transporter protein LptC
MSLIYHIRFSSNKWKTLLGSVFFLLLLVSCSNDDKSEKIGAFVNRSKMPKLQATDITTIISDSGITRYRISAPSWEMFDQAIKPYWEFSKGIHIERFDESLKVDANIHSKYAKFDRTEQIWELRGKVKATNLKGEIFETEQLYWNQRTEKFYTDSLTNITQGTKKIRATGGFESDQTMSKYQLRNNQAELPLNENN